MSVPQAVASAAVSILLVEDDAELARMIADYLRQHGYCAEIESRGDRAVQRILGAPPALVVLDLMLPGEDGLQICRRVRPGYAGPILMLTARGEANDEVFGLELGADDYLAKPVAPRVLLARVRALLRRGRPPEVPEVPKGPKGPKGPREHDAQRIQVAELVIERKSRTVHLLGAPLKLTSGEFDLLWVLAAHAGQELTRGFLYEQLHGTDLDEFDRSIDLRVSRLRQKLAERCGHDVIKTVRGVGYLYIRS